MRSGAECARKHLQLVLIKNELVKHDLSQIEIYFALHVYSINCIIHVELYDFM